MDSGTDRILHTLHGKTRSRLLFDLSLLFDPGPLPCSVSCPAPENYFFFLSGS